MEVMDCIRTWGGLNRSANPSMGIGGTKLDQTTIPSISNFSPLAALFWEAIFATILEDAQKNAASTVKRMATMGMEWISVPSAASPIMNRPVLQ